MYITFNSAKSFSHYDHTMIVVRIVLGVYQW